jgi:hypothetical protein
LATIFFHAGADVLEPAAAQPESFVIISLIPKAVSPKKLLPTVACDPFGGPSL